MFPIRSGAPGGWRKTDKYHAFGAVTVEAKQWGQWWYMLYGQSSWEKGRDNYDAVIGAEPEPVCVNREADVVKHEENKVVQEGDC